MLVVGKCLNSRSLHKQRAYPVMPDHHWPWPYGLCEVSQIEAFYFDWYVTKSRHLEVGKAIDVFNFLESALLYTNFYCIKLSIFSKSGYELTFTV